MKKGAPNPYSQSPAFNPDKEAIARVYENERLQKEVDGLFSWGKPVMAILVGGGLLIASAFGIRGFYESMVNPKNDDQKPAVAQAHAEVPAQQTLESVQAPKEVTKEGFVVDLMNRVNVYNTQGQVNKGNFVLEVIAMMNFNPSLKPSDFRTVLSSIDRAQEKNNQISTNDKNTILMDISKLHLKNAGVQQGR